MTIQILGSIGKVRVDIDRMIKHIKEICSEPELDGFGNIEPLEQGYVGVPGARANDESPGRRIVHVSYAGIANGAIGEQLRQLVGEVWP